MLPRIRVVIATTKGPVEVEQLTEEDKEIGDSAILVGKSTTPAGINALYQPFVALSTGIIGRRFGHEHFTLDLSAPIDAGNSWQLGVFLAHAALSAGRLAQKDDATPPDIVVLATGEVLRDETVKPVEAVSEKLTLAESALATAREEGSRVIVAWPRDNAGDVDEQRRRQLAELGAEVLEVGDFRPLLAALELHLPGEASWSGTPFRGLESFEEEHRAIFFGRDAVRDEALEQLREAAARDFAFLLIYGRSGGGKSSFVRAGLVGDIRARAGEADHWLVARLGTIASGGSPFIELGAALGRALREVDMQYATLAEQFAADPEEAMRALGAALRQAHPGGTTKLLLLLDPLEDLLLWAREHGADGAAQRDAFGRLLEHLARSGKVWIVATIRSDLLPLLEDSQPLSDLARDDRRRSLPRMGREELREIVQRPAALAGIKFETQGDGGRTLADMLIDDAASDPDSLPLLEFVLERLYADEGRSGTISFDTYKRLGGLKGAIAARAEATVRPLLNNRDLSSAVDSVVLALGRLDPESGRVLARTVPMAEFSPAQRQVLEALIGTRLVTADARDGNVGATVRVAHEAVLTHWPRAQEVFAGHRADLELRDHLESETRSWLAGGGDAAYLLRDGRPLGSAEELVRHGRVGLSDDVQAFIAASSAAAEQQRKAETDALRAKVRTATRRNFLLGGAAVLFAGVSGIAIKSSLDNQRNEQAAREALRQQQLATDLAKQNQSKSLVALGEVALSQGDAVTAALLALEVLREPDACAADASPVCDDAQNLLTRSVVANRELAALRTGGHFAADASGRWLVVDDPEAENQIFSIDPSADGMTSNIVPSVLPEAEAAALKELSFDPAPVVLLDSSAQPALTGVSKDRRLLRLGLGPNERPALESLPTNLPTDRFDALADGTIAVARAKSVSVWLPGRPEPTQTVQLDDTVGLVKLLGAGDEMRLAILETSAAAGGSPAQRLRIWSVDHTDAAPVECDLGGQTGLFALVPSHDGALLLTLAAPSSTFDRQAGGAVLWNAASGAELVRYPEQPVAPVDDEGTVGKFTDAGIPWQAAGFDPDSPALFLVSDTAAQFGVPSPDAPLGNVPLPFGAGLVTAKVIAFDLPHGLVVETIGINGWTLSLLPISHYDARLETDGGTTESIEFGPAMPLFRHDRKAAQAQFAGNRLFVLFEDDTLSVWNVDPGDAASSIDAAPEIASLREWLPRALTPDQRLRYGLSPQPPDWYIEKGKWPYDTQQWRDWLDQRRAGKAPAMPDA